MSTQIGRKCKTCSYFKGNWCYWLGRSRKPDQYECEDGWNDPNQIEK